MAVFTEMGKLILEFLWNYKRPTIGTTILKRKNKIGRLKLPNFKTNYEVILVNKVESWHKDKIEM